MTCDTNYILNPNDRSSGKLPELEKILEECRENAGVKIIIFSEWQRMLELVREICERLDLGYAWHTGSVPQRRRRAEINVFKSDPECRVFLSTDSGSTGLNLQNASVVINCDLPWNPARLEQRIARAWRKNQTRPVTVINLVAEKTIEERMLETLAQKQALADGVLDRRGDLDSIKLRTGGQAFYEKLKQLGIGNGASSPAKPAPPPRRVLPADRALGFAQAAQKQINGALLRCEERYPSAGSHSVLYCVVEGSAALWRARLADLHKEFFQNQDPLAPIQLEIVERSTDEALQRLIDAGLLARTIRASRPLFPLEDATAGTAPLSESERSQAAAHRAHAERRLKMARVLGDTGFVEETRPPLLEAAHALGRALAVEHRLPDPASVEQTILPPVSFLWDESLPAIRKFVAEGATEWEAFANVLQSKLA